MMDLHSLPADHIDLIITAAIEWGIITKPMTSPHPHRAMTATAQRIGSGLYQRNQELMPGESGAYRFRPVESPVDVIDVLKASHAAEFAYQRTQPWLGTDEQRVVAAVAKASAMRIPGYELAPWVWHRPVSNAIGYSNGEHPDIEHIEWIDSLDELIKCWEEAHIVLVTNDALPHLPELPNRPRVYCLTMDNAPSATVATAGQHRVAIDGVVIWPTGAQWLAQQLVR